MVSKETFTCSFIFISLTLLKIVNALEELTKESYDYYYLSLRHIKGICIERPCKFYQSSFNFNFNWTLHGLWPNKYNNQHPAFCSHLTIDMNQFPINLIEKIDKFWKNLYHSTPLSFFQNQWKKHGSCVDFGLYNINDLNQKLFYFSKAVSLMEEFNPNNYFSNANSNNDLVDPIELKRAIYNKYQTEFHMECQLDEKTGKKYIIKLRIPLDKNFKLIKDFHADNTNCDLIK